MYQEKKNIDKISKNEIYPLVITRGVFALPKITIPILFKSAPAYLAVKSVLKNDHLLVLSLTKNNHQQTTKVENTFHSTGVLVKVLESHELANHTVAALVEGKERVIINRTISSKPFIQVQVNKIPEIDKLNIEEEALLQNIENRFKKCIVLGLSVQFDTISLILSRATPSEKADLISFSLGLKTEEKQTILETNEFKKRLEILNQFIDRKLKVLQVAKKIEKKTTSELDKAQKEMILREQLKEIKKELGMKEREDVVDFKQKLAKADLPPEAKKVAQKEIKRLSNLPPFSPEISYLHNYLDWLISLPWKKQSVIKINLAKAKQILNKDHYGLQDVKERILEFLAVCQLTGKIKGPILCFLGPPGTGKTSIGQSIAHALGRKFIRLSLGGIRDEAEIRGHRRTYVGALPGRIIQNLRRVETNNPVFMLDEIDKIGSDFRGDPSSALLEALDPEQNSSFNDHYLEVPFDLSNIFFITTANVASTIPPALRDRMEIIRFPGYTEEEKFYIAKQHLIPKLLSRHGLDKNMLTFNNSVIKKIIAYYTREAGVRELERQLAKVCRQISKEIVMNKKKIGKYVIKQDNLTKYLGPAEYQPTLAEKKKEVGVVTGLAWTAVGGVILFIESSKMIGKGNLFLTGHLGKVMKESAQAALSYIRSRADKLKIDPKFAQKLDLHVHVPSGAIPKDGPSAGVAITVSLISCLINRAVKKDIAMTGEVTLRGKILEIGGVKEKVLAAHRAGIKTIILPESNKKDLVKIPAKTKKKLKFIFVNHLDQVLKYVFA